MTDGAPLSHSLLILPGRFGVCRLPADSVIPDWARPEGLMALVFTPDELSILCKERFVPPHIQAERGWRALKVEGPLDFSLVGVMASLLSPLADANVSVMTVSTFDTDYVLVKETHLERAVQALESAGHSLIS